MIEYEPLSPVFFDKPTLAVAKQLVGKFVVRKTTRGSLAMMISETEAYDGPTDLASHARFGRTPRTEPMFGPPGTIYVYLIYGLHWMLNIVCGEPGYPAAVLLRSAGAIQGPGRLAKALSVDKALNLRPLGPSAGLWIENRGAIVPPEAVAALPRVGVAYAGPYSEKPWRFMLKQSVTPE